MGSSDSKLDFVKPLLQVPQTQVLTKKAFSFIRFESLNFLLSSQFFAVVHKRQRKKKHFKNSKYSHI